MNQNNIERRRRSDIWVKLLHFFNFLSWILIAVIFIVFERAKPQFQSFFDRFYHLKLRTNWDFKFVDYLLWILVAGIIISIFGFLLSFVRSRRKDDRNQAGLIIMGVLSLLFLIGIELFLF